MLVPKNEVTSLELSKKTSDVRLWLQRNLFRDRWYVPHHKPAAQPFQYLFLIERHGFSSPLLYVSLLQLFASVHHPSGSDLTSPHLEKKRYKEINTER